MFTARWKLVRLVGIPIYVDASWFIILALITWSLANGFPQVVHEYFPDAAAVESPYQFWIMGLIAAVAFFVCILLHELGHAIVARSRGMRIRGITLFLFGGVADIGEEPPSALTEFMVAVAGPIVSLNLAVGLWLVATVGYHLGWPISLVVVLGYLAAINAIVLVFNLIPAFPLDGGRVFRSILWGVSGDERQATHWASLIGQGFAWLLIAWGVFELFSGNIIGGIWSGLIGLFLNNAARTTYQQLLIRQALAGEPVRRFMNTQPIFVSPALDLHHWIDDFVYRYHRKSFPVVSEGRLEGCIETQALANMSRSEWDRHTVGEVMRTDLNDLTIEPSADAMHALKKMQRVGVSRLLVAEGDRLVGVLTLRDLLKFLNLKLELEGSGTEEFERNGDHRHASSHNGSHHSTSA